MLFFSSVVVRDLHVVGVPLAPHETDTVLVVDANAMLACAIAFEPLQPVARRQRQVAQRSGRVHHLQLLERGFVKARRNAAAAFFAPKPLRLSIPESFDHRAILPRCVTSVKRQYTRRSGSTPGERNPVFFTRRSA